MQIIYLTGPIGSKQNGGSGLSGSRFLDLLVSRYGSVQVVTDANRNSLSPRDKVGIIKVKGVLHDYGTTLHSIARGIAVRLINITRPKVARLDCVGDDVLVICNSFTLLLDKIVLSNYRNIHFVCVVRGDTNSFEFQGWDATATAAPLKEPTDFLNRFDSIVFVSKTTKDNWSKLLNRPKNYFLLSNAIDEAEVVSLMSEPNVVHRASLGWAPNEFHVVVVGSIQKRKGQDIFSGAARELIASIPNCFVHFVGVVSSAWGGEDIVKGLKQTGEGRYIVHGHRDDVLKLVCASDTAVMVSRSEAFPRTIAEYMALGKPIITTPVAGADEMVIDGETGLIIPLDDSKALAIALGKMATNEELRSCLGKAAQERYFSNYSMVSQEGVFSNIFERIEETFVQV